MIARLSLSPLINIPTSTIRTRVLTLSDTHDLNYFTPKSKVLYLPQPKFDILLHCGDLTECGDLPSLQKSLEMLALIPAELKLVIPGNHDLSLDPEFCARQDRECGGGQSKWMERHEPVMELMTKSEEVKRAGVTYLTEGTHNFVLASGAMLRVYASPYTPCPEASEPWAFQYSRDEDRFNVLPEDIGEGKHSIARNPVSNSDPNVDIMITHGPPRGILDECRSGNIGCESLLRAVSRARPLLLAFGHVHAGVGGATISWDKDRSTRGEDATIWRERVLNPFPEAIDTENVTPGEKTVMINASIMGEEYKSPNKPWVVDIYLNRATEMEQ